MLWFIFFCHFLALQVNELIENPGMASAMQSGGGSEMGRRGMAQSLMSKSRAHYYTSEELCLYALPHLSCMQRVGKVGAVQWIKQLGSQPLVVDIHLCPRMWRLVFLANLTSHPASMPSLRMVTLPGFVWEWTRLLLSGSALSHLSLTPQV